MEQQVTFNKSGLVDPAVFPCYKAEGLCRYRTSGTAHFECCCNPDWCRARVKPKTAPPATTTAPPVEQPSKQQPDKLPEKQQEMKLV